VGDIEFGTECLVCGATTEDVTAEFVARGVRWCHACAAMTDQEVVW
jgi:hypothetical protein